MHVQCIITFTNNTIESILYCRFLYPFTRLPGTVKLFILHMCLCEIVAAAMHRISVAEGVLGV